MLTPCPLYPPMAWGKLNLAGVTAMVRAFPIARMATPPSASRPFRHPQVRWLLGGGLIAAFGTAFVLELLRIAARLPLTPEDPLFIPITYLALFGGSSLALVACYRRQGIALKPLFGPLPSAAMGRWAVWLTVTGFVFSVGAFQFTYGLLAWVAPEYVNAILNQTLFLGTLETPWPGLYNGLMVLVLLVAAPVLEELLFRGALIHRWGCRWQGGAAVVISSVLFGILHANWLGLGMLGLVLALLYLQTRSLWLVIGVHGLNNAMAVGIDRLMNGLALETAPTLAAFQQGWWFGLVLMAIALPVLIPFIRRTWPLTAQPLPYFANQMGHRP